MKGLPDFKVKKAKRYEWHVQLGTKIVGKFKTQTEACFWIEKTIRGATAQRKY